MAARSLFQRREAPSFVPNEGHRYLVVDDRYRPCGYLKHETFWRGDRLGRTQDLAVGDRVTFSVSPPLEVLPKGADAFVDDASLAYHQITMLLDRFRSRRGDDEHHCWVLRVEVGERHLGHLDGFQYLAEAHGQRVR